MMLSRIGVFLLATFALFGLYGVVHAQDVAGVKIIPSQIERGADPGQTFTETIIISNVSDEEKEFYLYKRNIKGVEAGGVPVFAEEGEVTGFEITEWIQLQSEPIKLAPNGETELPVTIAVPESATPGSHFGGIFISAEPPRLRETGAGVGYQVASIVSIRISGEVVDSVRIRSFSTDKLFYGTKDVSFEAKIENQGNILVRPRGPLTITSMFGGEPQAITVNDNLAGVFPGTVRNFEFSWSDEGIGFGRYEAVLALVYEGNGGQRTIDASLVFWVFPAKVIVPIIVVLLVVLGSMYIFARIYIRRAIVDAGGGRRIVTRRYQRQVGISRFTFVFVSLLTVLALFLIVLLLFFA